MKWFSDPQPTKEEAQALYEYEIFNPATVFETPEGRYSMGLLRVNISWTEQALAEIARSIQGAIGYKMVATCDPLLGIWKDYPR